MHVQSLRKAGLVIKDEGDPFDSQTGLQNRQMLGKSFESEANYVKCNSSPRDL